MSTKNRNAERLPVLGWREWIDLPEFGCGKIKVKVDTGARSSAIHALNVEEFQKEGEAWVRFDLHPDQRSSKRTVTAEAKVLEYRNVKNSGGKATKRPVVMTTISILDDTWPIELTLTNRDAMGFRMLLGRQAIRRRFSVDPGGSYYGGKPRPRKRRKKDRRL